MDGVAMRRELWRHFLFDFLHLRIRVARIEIFKCALGAIEQTACAFQRDNGVIEGWLFRIVRHRVNFLEFLAHALFDCRREVFIPDLVERRDVIWQRAFSQQWVVIEIGGEHGGDLRKPERCASEDANSIWHKALTSRRDARERNFWGALQAAFPNDDALENLWRRAMSILYARLAWIVDLVAWAIHLRGMSRAGDPGL
jgi:hypothetical protein